MASLWKRLSSNWLTRASLRRQTGNFVPPKANPTSVDELVAELVKHKELTAFQAAQVKAGKARS